MRDKVAETRLPIMVGVLAFDEIDVFDAGDIYAFFPVNPFTQYPAIYECCVGNKSYHPQTYVLGSPHESNKKKIVHAQSPYIP